VATYRICPTEAVHILITDKQAGPAVMPFRARGIEVQEV
jgi:hypothetical protein